MIGGWVSMVVNQDYSPQTMYNLTDELGLCAICDSLSQE